MTERFFGENLADCTPENDEYASIKSPSELFSLLSRLWCAETCAPRMRDRWSEENKTLGQCSISAFLAQDIFGGEVYGVMLGDGNYHCFNVVGTRIFDLTSAQFDHPLCYKVADEYRQKREVHFAKAEKKARYEYLKSALAKIASPE